MFLRGSSSVVIWLVRAIAELVEQVCPKLFVSNACHPSFGSNVATCLPLAEISSNNNCLKTATRLLAQSAAYCTIPDLIGIYSRFLRCRVVKPHSCCCYIPFSKYVITISGYSVCRQFHAIFLNHRILPGTNGACHSHTELDQK